MAAYLSITNTVLSLLAASIGYFFYRLYTVRRFFKDLPGPPHSFFWGHLKVMGEVSATFPPNVHPQALYTTIARKYNLQGMFYIDLWPLGPNQVILNDPELQDLVTVKRAYSQHQESADFLGPIVGDQNIAVVNGQAWKSMHNGISPAFSWSHIRSLTDMMVDECKHFRNALNGFAESGEVFSMEETAAKLIFDVIARIVYNFPLHAQTEGSRTLEDLQQMVVLAEMEADIAKKLNPWIQIKTWFARRELKGRLHPEIIDKVTERFELLKKNQIVPSRKEPHSIIDLMLRQKLKDEEANIKAGKPCELSSKEIRVFLDNTKGLLVGGHGTTTDTLCYCYMLLSTHPSIVTTLRAEHDHVLGQTHPQTISTLLSEPSLLQDLPYTEAVIKETLRLFPVGFGLRVANKGDTITPPSPPNSPPLPIDNNLALVSNAHDVHYNAAYFPSPTKFDPTRWLDPQTEIPRSHFRTFSRGPRACLGQNLAMNELKIILVLTVREFVFECAGLKKNETPRHPEYTDLDGVYGDIVFQELGLEAKPRGGMMMKVRRTGWVGGEVR